MRSQPSVISDSEMNHVFNSVWGQALGAGFQRLPDALLKYQSRLGLSPLDVVIILNIGIHWWTAENSPHPKIELIARRIGASRRSIERRLLQMERRGLVFRRPYETNDNGKKIRRFDLSGLVRAVEHYAVRDPAFIERQRRSDMKLSSPATENNHVVQSQAGPTSTNTP